MLAIEGRSRMRGDGERARRLSGRGVERVQPVAAGEPDMLAVIGDAADIRDAGEGAVLLENFGC